MTLALWNLAAYSAQLAVLAVAAATAAALFRLNSPRISVRYWQVVLAACFALPLLQTWSATPGDTVRRLDQLHLECRPRRRPMAPARSIPRLIVIAVLATGVAIRLVWLGLGLWRLRSITRRAEPATPLLELSTQLQATLGAQSSPVDR